MGGLLSETGKEPFGFEETHTTVKVRLGSPTFGPNDKQIFSKWLYLV